MNIEIETIFPFCHQVKSHFLCCTSSVGVDNPSFFRRKSLFAVEDVFFKVFSLQVQVEIFSILGAQTSTAG